MRVLIVENFRDTGLGQVETALDEAGALKDHRRMFNGDGLPADAAGHDALIVLGGEQNALDDEGSPWFPALVDLIRDFESRDRAVLGICLGAQLIARAFGGKNSVGGHREFGWCPVALTDEGAGDPVFSALPKTFPIFQWHDDSFSLPPAAMRLATNERVENQAFRIGRAVYGTQFHFEADRRLVEAWTQIFGPQLAKSEPLWLQKRAEHAAQYGPDADAAGLALARAWVGLI